jgi:hypothetical protein
MTNSNHPEITDTTIVRTEWARRIDNPPQRTWAEWKARNGDTFETWEFSEIVETIRWPGRRFGIGGGAAPMAFVSRVDLSGGQA